ncbi:MAG TPA: S41 family peptidase [Dokdonella sp.]|uniref:S41 family peptidase n=1 Tax=Dokdonella sp. TaxID=2291710 RepID=UPI0025C20815|nr:S41 family peptidase [Dokdonella sp.]HNR91381.1 S41 family peptidase [Dokdonella sp.]
MPRSLSMPSYPRFRRAILAAALGLCATAALAVDPPEPVPDEEPIEAPAADASAASRPGDVPAAQQISLEDVRTFTAVLSLVKEAYVEKVDDRRLMRAAIHGLLNDLDPHSEYLERKALESLGEDASGSYPGLGIEVTTVDGTLRVISPIDDTPAARAGIRPGDIILRIDDTAIVTDNVGEAVDMLRGAPGTEVTLSILREGAAAPQEFRLKRETIRVASVRGRLLEPGYAYLRVSQFQSETGSELRKRIERLKKDNGKPLAGAVLDLRANPGGLLTAAVEVSDALLDSGTIVTTRGRIREAEMAFRATPGDLLDGAPVVVLIDNGSASAAEIVAGALQDNRRALLMGRRSFGKGSVQTVLQLDEERAIKITTARYYTPSGASIQAAGIVPDIELADLALTENEPSSYPVTSERDLRGHLRGDNEATATTTSPAVHSGAPRDYALNEALNALKAMALQRRAGPGKG